jgi:hypothetical protein
MRQFSSLPDWIWELNISCKTLVELLNRNRKKREDIGWAIHILYNILYTLVHGLYLYKTPENSAYREYYTLCVYYSEPETKDLLNMPCIENTAAQHAEHRITRGNCNQILMKCVYVYSRRRCIFVVFSFFREDSSNEAEQKTREQLFVYIQRWVDPCKFYLPLFHFNFTTTTRKLRNGHARLVFAR